MIYSFELSVRQLDQHDAKAFRALRLKLLDEEGEKFGPRYEDEVRLHCNDWKTRVTPTADTRVFGLFRRKRRFLFFHQTQLVGITRVTKWEGEPSEPTAPTGRVALWGQTGVLEYLRGKYDENGEKCTAPLYGIRGKVTFEDLGYEQAVAFIKEDNDRSKTALTNFGAQFMFKRTMNWPTRLPAIWNFYRITKESYLEAVQSRSAKRAAKTLSLLQRELEPVLTRGGTTPTIQPGMLKAG